VPGRSSRCCARWPGGRAASAPALLRLQCQAAELLNPITEICRPPHHLIGLPCSTGGMIGILPCVPFTLLRPRRLATSSLLSYAPLSALPPLGPVLALGMGSFPVGEHYARHYLR
jgi:hypothetical protein